MSTLSRPCFFFDRDGVVNVTPGPGYVLSWEAFHFQDGIETVLAALRAKGYLLVLVTSQKGVGKGLMSHVELSRIHENMQAHLAVHGAQFDAIYAYTGRPEGAYAPKPDPAMMMAAQEDHGIDLSQSWVIGDADRDIEMGQRAKLKGTVRLLGDKTVTVEATHKVASLEAFSALFGLFDLS